MTKIEANEILDRVKHGLPASQTQITEALIITGDIGIHEGVRSEGLDGQIQGESLRAWSESRTSLVGQSSIRHSAYSR